MAAEFLWQAKKSTRDYHDAMNDSMFTELLEQRVTPDFNAKFSGKKMIFIVDNDPYHHGYDPEVGVPGSNRRGTTLTFW